jgi:lysophospholipase L1-like esterase
VPGRNAGALVLSLVIGLLLAEVMTRFAEGFPLLPLVPPAITPAPTIAVVPSETRVYQLPVGPPITNSAGLHDHEYPVSKPPNTVRIVALGDSVTYGYRVKLDESLTKRLEQKLNDQGKRKVEVLNFGVPGYNTTQELAYLRDTALDYNPDLVLLIYVLNDADPAIVPEHGLGRAPDNPEPPELLTQTIGRFYFPQLLYAAYGRLRVPTGAVDDPRAKFTEANPGWTDSRSALRDMAALTRSRGIPFVVAIFPYLVQLDDRYPYAAIHELVGQAIADAGAYSLDLFPAFRGYSARPLWVGPADQHPNAQGHEIAAQAIYQFLEARDLVP